MEGSYTCSVTGRPSAFAVASAAFVRFGDDEMDRGWASRRGAFVAAMLPAGASGGSAPGGGQQRGRTAPVAVVAGVAGRGGRLALTKLS